MKFTTFTVVPLILMGGLPLYAVPKGHQLSEDNQTAIGSIALLGSTPKPRIIDPLVMEAGEHAQTAIVQGEALLRAGKTEAALSSFQSAMQYLPNDPLALQRIAETYTSVGRLAEASQTYYRLFNEAKWQAVSGSPTVYLEYALVLVKTGQPDQAIPFYQEAAARMNYTNGTQNLKVLLPELVEYRVLPDQVRYTPECLQALANTALAHEEMAFGSDKEALAHMREAVKLFPDSPVTHYYLGEALLMKDGAGAKIEYQKAADLGDDKTVAAAKERLKMIP